MHKELEFKHFQISLWEEWSQFFNVKRYNWCDFSFVNFHVEYDRHLGGLELGITLFGFAIWMRLPVETDKSKEEWDKLGKQMEQINSGTKGWVISEELKQFKETNLAFLVFRTRKNARKQSRAWFNNSKTKKIWFYEY